MSRRWSGGRRGWLTPWRILVTLALVAGGAGFVGVQALHQEIRTQAVANAAVNARLICTLVVRNNIVASDLNGGSLDAHRRADMDSDVAEMIGAHQLVGLEVWAIGDRSSIYADRGHSRGEAKMPATEIVRARQGAFSAISLTGRAGPTLDWFLPLDIDGDGGADAVMEVLAPWEPITREITRSTGLIDGCAALVALLGVFLLWRVWLRQRRQAYAARHDALTGLGNRTLLVERVSEVLAAGGGTSALLLLDVDRFKEINDTLGHHAGDELLVSVAGRVKAGVRAKDTVVRLGGDEFAVLLPDLADPHTAQVTAHRLCEALRQPTTVAGLAIEVDVSVGIALAPEHGTDVNTLLRCVDAAMYDAKHNGHGVTTYDPATDTRDEHQLTVLAELRNAITAGQLRLFYQPKCRRDGTIEHVEALVRWQHPERGLLSPFVFVPLAERTSLIRPLTAWVIGEATRQCAAWRDAGQPLGVAVNISPRNLADAELPGIVLEITETAVTTDPERAHATLHRLRGMGVSVSIDDFGTGYTSLSQLGELPVNTLKIDRMFVADLLTNPVHEAVVRNVTRLARDLGLTTVAEGVESYDVWARLNEFECDEIQGYVLTPPLPPDQLTTWLADWRTAAEIAAISQ